MCKRVSLFHKEGFVSVVEHHLKYWAKEPPSEAGIRVAELLDDWQGLHHFEESAMKRVEWHNTRFLTVTLSKHCGPGRLSTFDFSALTSLVFLAHDYCIRVEIESANNTHLRVTFHPRHVREGNMSLRHPTLETAVAAWRENHQSKELAPAPAEASTP
jgi:hypothetical protein